jgi:hypothetical protein
VVASASGLRLTAATTAAFAVLAFGGAAAARPAHLEWNAPAGCADTATLQAAVERLLDEPTTEGDEFRAQATVVRASDGTFTLTLAIRTVDDLGTRTVEASDCETLLHVAAFSIALALNPALAETSSAPPESAPSAPPPTSEPAPESVAKPSPPPTPPATGSAPVAAHPSTPARAQPAELWLSAYGVLDSSLLPAWAPGFAALGDLSLLERFRFGLGGAAFVPQTTKSADGGGHFSLWSLEAHGCAEARLGVELGACPTLQLAHVQGEGRGVTPRLSQYAWVPAPGLTLFATRGLTPRLAGSLRVTGLFPLNHDAFVIAAGPVHTIPRFSAELALGLAVRTF